MSRLQTLLAPRGVLLLDKLPLSFPQERVLDNILSKSLATFRKNRSFPAWILSLAVLPRQERPGFSDSFA